jgi:3',5'-cyclic AMP phosphodiesterase CpdA
VLDSLVPAPPGERIDHGELAPESLAWLDDQLDADRRPAFVCLHHPPHDIGLGLMAPILLRDPRRLAEVVGRHDHVVATLVGHAHTMCATTFAGRPVLVGGGVASTVPYDAEPYPVISEALPPTIALHLLHDDGRLTTHWRALPETSV